MSLPVVRINNELFYKDDATRTYRAVKDATRCYGFAAASRGDLLIEDVNIDAPDPPHISALRRAIDEADWDVRQLTHLLNTAYRERYKIEMDDHGDAALAARTAAQDHADIQTAFTAAVNRYRDGLAALAIALKVGAERT
jgi:hypothetical protein